MSVAPGGGGWSLSLCQCQTLVVGAGIVSYNVIIEVKCIKGTRSLSVLFLTTACTSTIKIRSLINNVFIT